MPTAARQPRGIEFRSTQEVISLVYPPILSPQQFAAMFGVSRSTVYFWIAQGVLKGAVTKIGKHRRIWRDRAVEIIFNRNQHKENQNEDTK